MTPETLAPDVAWEPDGCLSEVALSVAADGEDALLDAKMHEHLASCEGCTIQLGNMALRAAGTREALLDPSVASVVRDIRASLPVAAGAPQIVVAQSQSLPSDVRQSLPSDVRQSLPSSVAQSLPIGVTPWAPPASVRASSPDLVRARRRVPMAALVPALVVAALGAIPSLMQVPAQAAQTWSVLREIAPAFLRIAPHAVAKAWGGPRGTMVVLAVWTLAAMLVATGLGIAKRQSKKLIVDGGRR